MCFDKFEENKNKQIELVERLRQTDLPSSRKYLNEIEVLIEKAYGFKASYESMKSVDENGEPIPWMTYPAIFFIEQLDLTNLDVFEWGWRQFKLIFF